MGAVFDKEREELVHLAGDQPDPLTGMPGVETARAGGGIMSTVRMTKSAAGHPKVRYKDFVLELDVYEPPGAPRYVHLICPRCRHALRITEDRKAMEYDPTRDVENGGRISVEKFTCTWELPEDRRMEFGLGLCRWTVAIDNNVARDA